MNPNPQYINSVIDKLERLNLANHGTKSPINTNNSEGSSYLEPKLEDPLQWMGRAAIEYMNRQKNQI
jgi:hypothetical protein